MNIEDYMYYREKGVEFDLQLYDKQQISCLPSLQEQDVINFQLLPLIFPIVTPLTAIYQTQSKQKLAVKKNNKRTVAIAGVKRWEGPPEGGFL